MTEQDSALVVSSFITRWATQKLLMSGAQRNITSEEQERLNNLVNQYRSELYSQAYKDALVERNLDSTITDAEAKAFYKENKANFKLNEELLKLRYIKMADTDYNNSSFNLKLALFSL